LIPTLDDDTVVVSAGVRPGRSAGAVVSDFIDVDDYLSGREEMRRRELVWGMVREPPAPRFGHQTIVGRAFALLDRHVREQRLGVVCVSPADVILDRERALIVQPDVFYIAAARMDIVRDQVWGAPDLVVEVASAGTERYDRTTKIEWYQCYGVREAWIVDPTALTVTVTDLESPQAPVRTFLDDEPIASRVLPDLYCLAREVFE
jgi:Uma2 family endonuclease